MRTFRLLSIAVLMLVAALPVAAQTPAPTLPVIIMVTTGADGTADSPMMTFKTIDGLTVGGALLDLPGDLGPGATNVYSTTITANFCDITQFELTKPTLSGSDDPWQPAALSVTIDGVELYNNTAFGSTLTMSNSSGGTWQATRAYRERCGVLAWTLVELQVVTGDNGTTDALEMEIGGSFAGAPYVQVLDQPGALGPFQTDDFIFIVPMEFCEMTSFQLRKPMRGAVDDDWFVTQISLRIDGTDVFFNSDIGTPNPVTATSFPPNGTWNGVAAYSDRCTGLAAPPMLDPMLEIDLSDLIIPPVTLQVPSTIPLANLQLLQPTAQPTLNLNVVPLMVTPVIPPLPNTLPEVLPLQPALASCPGLLPSRLEVGLLGRVTPGGPNNVRSAPSLQAQLVGQIPGEGVFTVLSGPMCADNLPWWEVDYNGLRGWTAEGQGNTYWLEPAQALG